MINLDTPLRLFTASPYPEFDYIITPKEYEFCANQSLFSFIRGTNYHFKWLDVAPKQVLDYVYAQACILKFNNQGTGSWEMKATLEKIFQWGSENPYDKIAYDTVADIVEAVCWADNYLDILEERGFGHAIYKKALWYADHIMKPIRFAEETWTDYGIKIKKLKMEARTNARNAEAKAIIIEKSRELKAMDSGIVPTPQTLNKHTEYEVRKIKSITEEGVVWQKKTSYNLDKFKKIKEVYPDATQEQLAQYMKMSLRSVKYLAKEYVESLSE